MFGLCTGVPTGARRVSLNGSLAVRLETSEGPLRGIMTTVRKGGVVVLMVTALIFSACASSTSPSTTTTNGSAPQITTVTLSPPKTYPLLSDGWNGGVALTALHVGRFHAFSTSQGACAWLGGQRAFLWPAGYRVRFNPTELIAPGGAVVGREGTLMFVGGGVAAQKSTSRCWSTPSYAWDAMASVKAGHIP